MTEIYLEDITECIAIIKINRSYREGMSSEALYDCTRGCWKHSIEYAEQAEYVLSVANGIVVEVYKPLSWMSAEELNRKTYPYNEKDDAGRIGFEGQLAPDNIRKKYIGKSVKPLFKKGNVNPLQIIKPQ